MSIFIFTLFVWGAWNAAFAMEKTNNTSSKVFKRMKPEDLIIHPPFTYEKSNKYFSNVSVLKQD
jgi:hypothetical protein